MVGYVKQQLEELTVYCEPTFVTDSFLECTQYARFCRGRNLMINFTSLVNRKEPIRYAIDVLKQGEIGGYCKLNNAKLKEQLDHVSALQSWAPELRFFESLRERPIENGVCDVVIDKPSFIMKIDANMNMYHHFCDFLNLYASQHINFTRPGAFSTDVNILLWESYPYNSPFAKTFEAFTDNPLLNLNTFKGKVVCFTNVVMPLLPRMIFGLYYNTPIVSYLVYLKLFIQIFFSLRYLAARTARFSMPSLNTFSIVCKSNRNCIMKIKSESPSCSETQNLEKF